MTPFSVVIQWLFYNVGGILLAGFVSPCPRRWSDQYDAVLSDHFCPVIKHSNPHENGFFQYDHVLIHWALGISERFDEYEEDVNHALRPLQLLV